MVYIIHSHTHTYTHTHYYTVLPPRPVKTKVSAGLDLAVGSSFKDHHDSTGQLAASRRQRMLKSHSQGDGIDNDDSSLFVPGGHGSTRPVRVHYYEEVKPKLTYVDIDLARNRQRAAARTLK